MSIGTLQTDESDFSEQEGVAFHSGESHVVDGGKILFSGRMDPGEDTDRMTAVRQYTGLCDMVSFFIDILGVCAFGAVPDKPEGLKFTAIRLYHITVVDVDDGLRRGPLRTVLR